MKGAASSIRLVTVSTEQAGHALSSSDLPEQRRNDVLGGFLQHPVLPSG